MSNDEQQNPQPEIQEINQAPTRGARNTGGSESSVEPGAEPVAQPQATHHSKQQQQNPNVRLRELLSIPERLRTDAQWDEIIDIEISIGPRKSPFHLRPQHQPAFRQNDNRGDRSDRGDRSEKKHGGGSAGAPSGNKHMRKRNNKNTGGQPGGNRPPQGGGGGQGGGSRSGSSGSE